MQIVCSRITCSGGIGECSPVTDLGGRDPQNKDRHTLIVSTLKSLDPFQRSQGVL